jgi:pilus assembly protein CpaC
MNKRRGSGTTDLIPWLLVAMSLMLGHSARAADLASRQQAITLDAGQSQVIENIDPASKPEIRVISNAHALVVHNEDPSKLILLGAEGGKWAISVKTKDGQQVTYNINVSSIRDSSAPLKPAAAPAALGDESSSSSPSTAAPVAGPMPAALPPMASAAAPASISPMDSGTGAGPNPGPDLMGETAGGPVSAAGSHVSHVPGIALTATDPGEPEKMGEPAPIPAGTKGSSVIPSQAAATALEEHGKFTSDPAVTSSGEPYSTDGVAYSGGSHFLPADGISMMNGTSQVIDFPQRMRRVSIADSTIADVQVISPYELNLIGHKPGFTTLTVWTGQGHYEERQVRISENGKQQVLLNCIVAELDRGQVENQGANISIALQKYGISAVGLPGAVATPYTATATLQPVVTNAFGQTISQSGELPTNGSLIPLLLSQGMTYGLAMGNSNISSQSFFQYLENHNMAKILAEPRLLANTGEKAKFLSGGEIPIVIAQALNTSIVFKEFGTKVVFVPTVVGLNDIELLVQPEVSEPNYSQGVQLFGFQVPAFVTRRAETQVRIRDNQTLIIAGLILHEKKQIIQKVPYLGDLPYAGGLFRNTEWDDTETDLVMSVTPQIVRALPSGSDVYLPTSRPPLTKEEIKTEQTTTPDAARPRF